MKWKKHKPMAKRENNIIPEEIQLKHDIVKQNINKYFSFFKTLQYKFNVDITDNTFFLYCLDYKIYNHKIDREVNFSFTPVGKDGKEENIFSCLIYKSIKDNLRDYGDDISMPFYFKKYHLGYDKQRLRLEYYKGSFEQQVEGVIKEYAHLFQTDFKEVLEGKSWIEGASLDWHSV